MSILELKARSSAGIKKLDYRFNDHTSPTFEMASDDYTPGETERALLINWELPTGPELYQTVLSWKVKYWQYSKYSNRNTLFTRYLRAPFNASTVTWETLPSYRNADFSRYTGVPSGNEGYWITDDSSVAAYEIVKNGLMFLGDTDYDRAVVINTANGPHPPILTVTFGDRINAKITNPTPGAGARLDKTQQNTFSFSIAEIGQAKIIGKIAPETAKFTWRVRESATENEIQMGANQSVAVPANTFPCAELQYKFTVRTNSGQDLVSDWITVYTTDTKSTAVALSPDGGIINTDSPTTFTWQHSNSSGAPQTSAEIALQRDSESETLHRLPNSPEMFYTFQPGILKNGKYKWRVRTYNLDGIAGTWSAYKQFLAIGKPSAPRINYAEYSPRPKIQWQSEYQSAYQIKIDDQEVLTYYGQTKSWRSPSYLEEGSHAIQIRIQDSYGMWSDWEKTTVTAYNTPGKPIALEVHCGNSAQLSWNDAGYHFYLIYRDGQPIGKTEDTNYIDDYSIGYTEYFVRGCYNNSRNYGVSSKHKIVIQPSAPVIKMESDPEWISMELSDQQHRVINVRRGQRIKNRYMVGRPYPVATKTPYKSMQIDIDFSSEEADVKTAIEAAVGEMVCVKLPEGIMVRGHLVELPSVYGTFYNGFSVSVQQEFIQEVILLD